MLIYKYLDTIVVFGWSAFVLVFRDLVIQYSIIPQTYSIDSFLEKKQTNSTLCLICLHSFAFLRCKMPMFCRAGMRGGGKPLPLAFQYLILSKLWNQVPSLDHFVVQNSWDFLCWKYKEVVCFYVSNLRQ